jgi:hypothetical protein
MKLFIAIFVENLLLRKVILQKFGRDDMTVKELQNILAGPEVTPDMEMHVFDTAGNISGILRSARVGFADGGGKQVDLEYEETHYMGELTNAILDAPVSSAVTLKERLQEICKALEPDEDIQSLAQDIYYDMESIPHPTDDEPVNGENIHLLEVDLQNNTVKLVAGGDWQDPVMYQAKWENSCFSLVPGSVILSKFIEGLTLKQIRELIL